MINLILLVIFMCLALFVIRKASDLLDKQIRQDPLLFPPPVSKHRYCACGCKRIFPANHGWDGYHGPGAGSYVPGQEPKAIDYDPNSVLGWEDIQWTVEKRLPEEK